MRLDQITPRESCQELSTVFYGLLGQHPAERIRFYEAGYRLAHKNQAPRTIFEPRSPEGGFSGDRPLQ